MTPKNHKPKGNSRGITLELSLLMKILPSYGVEKLLIILLITVGEYNAALSAGLDEAKLLHLFL